MDRKERIACLESRNAVASQGHEPSEADQRMVMRKHPWATTYLNLQAVYQTLKYAADDGQRYLAFEDYDNYAILHRPALRISCQPWSSEVDYESIAAALKDVRPCYPGTDWEQYLQYVDRCGELGWPKWCRPSVEFDIKIVTTNVKLAADILVLTDGRVIPERRSQTKRAFKLHVYPFGDLDGNVAMPTISAIQRRMHRGLLEARTVDDNLRDNAHLELPQKPFRLAAVGEVTVSDRAVLVPLVPAGDQSAVLKVAQALTGLCRQGYPWKGDVRSWCEQFLRPKALRALDKEFAAGAAVPQPKGDDDGE